MQNAMLAATVDEMVARPMLRHGRFGIAVHRLDDGAPLYELNSGQIFQGASTTKLLTTASALDALGIAHRFHTRIERTGPVDAAGTLRGDLVLVGSGDPNLSNRIETDDTLAFADLDHALSGMRGARALAGDPLAVVRKLARDVFAAGIRRITGSVRIDTALFAEGFRELGTFAVVSPVCINDNLIDLHVTAGAAPGDAVAIDVVPKSDYVRFVNELRTVAAGETATFAMSAEQPSPDETRTRTVTLSGAVPAGSVQLYAHPVDSPSRYAHAVFSEALALTGIVVDEPHPNTLAPALGGPRERVAEHISPPFSEAVKVVNKVSQNLHAELLPCIVGATVGNTPGDGAAAAGYAAEAAFFHAAEIDLDGAIQGDACGALGYFSPDFMCRFLRRVSTLPFAAQFEASLPVMARDGTLADVQKNSPAAGLVNGKTGTMTAPDHLRGGLLIMAKGLAGYMTTKSGQRVAFAAYINLVPWSDGSGVGILGETLGEIATAIHQGL